MLAKKPKKSRRLTFQLLDKMKKSKTKLSLNKKTVFNLNDGELKNVKGGGFTGTCFWCDQDNSRGCSDGCPTVFETQLNCTLGTCTADCPQDQIL